MSRARLITRLAARMPLPLVIAASSALAPGSVGAQSIPPPITPPGAVNGGPVFDGNSIPQGVGVADRYRGDYASVGGRIGSFFLYPRFDLDGVVTDNVRALDSDKRGDQYATIRADTQLVSNFSRHALNLEGFVSRSQHARQTQENVTNYGGKATGKLDVRRQTTLGVTLVAERLTQDRSDFNSPIAALAPIQYTHLSARAAAQQSFNRLTLIGSVTASKFDYGDGRDQVTGAVISQRYRDFGDLAADLSVIYEFEPGFSVLARGVVDRTRYSLAPNDPLQPGNLDRNSSGARIEAGAKIELTSLLYGQVRVGYLNRRYSDLRLIDTSGLSFGADLLWNVTPLTSIRLIADRRIDEASSTLIAGNRVTDVSGMIDHELRRNLVLSARLRYVRIAPLGPSPVSNEVHGTLGARYLISRRYSLRAEYAHNQRRSLDPNRVYTENRAMIGVTLTL